MTILDEIKEKLKANKNTVKILLSFKAFTKMVDEEQLKTKFCTNCKSFLGSLEKHCKSCAPDKEQIIDKELPIMTIENLPFEVTSKVNHVEVI